MDISYCYEQCKAGKAAGKTFLAISESVFDAAYDFNCFVENCFKNCPYKEEHNKHKETL